MSFRKSPKMLNHNDKRVIAKELVSGKSIKRIALEWGVSYTQIFSVKRAYVTVTLGEKYPDDMMNGGLIADDGSTARTLHDT